QMLDSNLAADEGKLEYMGRMLSGRQAVINLVQNDEPLVIETLADRFTLSAMLDRSAQDNPFLASYLYYFGMLTIAGKDEYNNVLLAPPNLAMKKLYANQILRFLFPSGTERNEAYEVSRQFIRQHTLKSLIAFVEQKLFSIFSNRDYRWMDEFALKMAFTSLLFR
ncbi:MAG: AAA family ATPase, partial [Desulfobacteraceae bacterium]|nr:AAA family ATPase [Desulfobacteraceae bacterium]